MSEPSEEPDPLATGPNGTRTLLIGRQPILDPNGRTGAHDLLFRDSSDSERMAFSDGFRATARVLAAAFDGFGMETLLGSLPGFVNIDP